MRVNREIRASQVRVISAAGEQLGVLSLYEAMQLAKEQGLDLVEVVATSTPPVCKIIDYGKFRYDQTKREKEGKKAQHQMKIKELKVGPNITDHDLGVKIRHAKEFLINGDKVKFSCMFRGREMMHQHLGGKLFDKISQEIEELGTIEAPPKFLGRVLSMVVAPGVKKKK